MPPSSSMEPRPSVCPGCPEPSQCCETAVCFSIWAGCHDKALEMRGLRNRNLILTVSEAASLRPRCSHGQFLVKTHFLACQRPPSLCLPRAFPWYMLMGRGRELPPHSFTIPSSCRTILEVLSTASELAHTQPTSQHGVSLGSAPARPPLLLQE